jgi:hypothetical protein
MMRVRRNLEKCQTRLQGWSRMKYGNIEKKVKKKTIPLTKLQQDEGVENGEKNKKVTIGNR